MKIDELLESHRRFHHKVGCPGQECYVCEAEQAYETAKITEQPVELPPEWQNGKAFTFCDEPGEHDPCYVVCPNGWMLPFNFSATPGADVASAKWVIAACNTYLRQPEREFIAPAGYALVPEFALAWLFGEEGSFEKPENAKGNYWWRSVFRKMIEQPRRG